eukprot:12160610-Ditylum_brightwellii.AAC.1
MSYKSALTSTARSPSTSIPIVFPECSKGKGKKKISQCYYKYGFHPHWDSNHSGIEMPKDLHELIKISDDEGNLVKSFADLKKKRYKSSCHKKRQTPTKTKAIPNNSKNTINSSFEGNTGSSFMLSSVNIQK